MYTNNSMSNNNVNKFYRPATWESICFNDPEKAMVLDGYFEKIGWYPTRASIPTVNLTYGIISPIITHITSPGFLGYTSEYTAITKSCKTGKKVRPHRNASYNDIKDCRFAYAADVPTVILKDFIDRTVCWYGPSVQYNKFLKNRAFFNNAAKEAESLKAENESLKKQLDTFKKSVENLYNMTTK